MTEELTLADYDGMDFWTAFPGDDWDKPVERVYLKLVVGSLEDEEETRP